MVENEPIGVVAEQGALVQGPLHHTAVTQNRDDRFVVPLLVRPQDHVSAVEDSPLLLGLDQRCKLVERHPPARFIVRW